MPFKIIRQLRQFGREVIVTDSPPGLLPDLFLRIQVGRGHGKLDDFQAWVGGQQLPDRFTAMPGRTIPEEQNRLSWKGVKHLLQMLGTDLSIEGGRTGHHFSARLHIQGAVEADFAAPSGDPNNGCLPARRPDVHGGGLQVHPGFILRQDDGFGHALSDVDQFFSATASKSITSRSRRDVYTFSVRW